jgi:hypothetical protein
VHFPRTKYLVSRAPHFRFRNATEVVMDTAFLVCALVGGTLIACQFLLTLIGLGGHHDTGGDHDFGGHDAGGHDAGGHDAAGNDTVHDHHGGSHAASWFLSVLTFRTITAGVAFFGLTGLVLSKADMGPAVSLGGAILAGLAALFAVSWAMRSLSRLNIDGTLYIRRAVGAEGTVYLSIPANRTGVGKVHVTMAGRLVEYKAVTSDIELPTGTKIAVVGIVDQDTLEVIPATSTERVSHE